MTASYFQTRYPLEPLSNFQAFPSTTRGPFRRILECIHKILLILTSHPFFPQFSFGKMTILPPSVWPSTKFTWTVILKKLLLICFESYWVSPIPTGRVLMATLQHFSNGYHYPHE